MGKVYHNNFDYESYLRTPHWLGLKARMYLKYKRCQRCRTSKNLNVHHEKGYANIGHEKLSELRLLCRDCHYRRHREQAGLTHLKPSDYFYYIGRVAGFFFRG